MASSLAGSMEAAFCCVALRDGFVPASADISDLDPEFDGVNVVSAPINYAPRVALTNSSGFGGTNVAVVLGK